MQNSKIKAKTSTQPERRTTCVCVCLVEERILERDWGHIVYDAGKIRGSLSYLSNLTLASPRFAASAW